MLSARNHTVAREATHVNALTYIVGRKGLLEEDIRCTSIHEADSRNREQDQGHG